MTVRIAHLTDVHWMVRPTMADLLSKRILGTMNLYVAGRVHEFDEAAQAALVAHTRALAPDAVVVTGDITAQALPAEFAKARAALDPLLSAFPALVQNGNHDVYVGAAYRERWIARWFGPWMHQDRCAPIARLDVGHVTVLGLDPNRASWDASGCVPADQLAKLEEVLGADDLADRAVLLAIHYPVAGPRGTAYDHWYHGLSNARALIDVLARARRAPDAILHGHKHSAYRTTITAGDRSIASFDPGSGGYALDLRHRHRAAMNVYTVIGRAIDVERYVWDGRGFVAEEGGAYASGW